MALPVTHTIRIEQLHNIPYDATTYKNIGAPPKFHVFCSCQWAGWTHTQEAADYYVASHRQAQLMRGNIVQVIAPASATASGPVDAPKPFTADAPSPVQTDAHEAEVAKELHDTLGVKAEVVDGVPIVDISPELTQFPPDGLKKTLHAKPLDPSAVKGLKSEAEAKS